MILEAAEASAAELRADAARQSSEHVGRVQRAAGAMLDRIDEIERELRALRASAERLTEGLAQLHEQAGELGAMADAARRGLRRRRPGVVARSPPPEPPPRRSSPTDAPAPSANGDEAGARLIALNMALSGTPREETARYLSEHFELADGGALLDDVYERAAR